MTQNTEQTIGTSMNEVNNTSLTPGADELKGEFDAKPSKSKTTKKEEAANKALEEYLKHEFAVHPDKRKMIAGEYIGYSGLDIPIFVKEHLAKDLRYHTLKMEIQYKGESIDKNNIVSYFIEKIKVHCSDEKLLWGSIYMEAMKREYTPVVEYLNNVHNKNKFIDINWLAKKLFGNEDELANIQLKKTLIAAVARAFKPGCQVDTVCMLNGKQGARKSTFWRTLASKEFFDDNVKSLANSSKDELAKLHRCWIQELPECESILRQSSSGNKATLSRQIDVYRRPYTAAEKEYLRACIIVGTTNESNLLTDATGNRRSWIIDIHCEEIDIEWLEANRDAIWASAVKEYREGNHWWLTKAEDALNNLNNEDYLTEDPWEEDVEEFLRSITNQEHFKKPEVLTALNLPINCKDYKALARIDKILTKLKVETKRVTKKKITVKVNPYYDPTRKAHYKAAKEYLG
jgi:predicted P-loop ATPase